jgi:hypothetical protein
VLDVDSHELRYYADEKMKKPKVRIPSPRSREPDVFLYFSHSNASLTTSLSQGSINLVYSESSDAQVIYIHLLSTHSPLPSSPLLFVFNQISWHDGDMILGLQFPNSHGSSLLDREPSRSSSALLNPTIGNAPVNLNITTEAEVSVQNIASAKGQFKVLISSSNLDSVNGQL